MLVNLTDVFTSEGKEVSKQVDMEMEQYSMMGDVYPVFDKRPIELSFTNIGTGKVLIKGSAECTIVMACDRCLKDVNYKFLLHFSREVFSPENMNRDEEDDEQNFMEGYHLNVEALISNEILLNWPMKILCHDDCKGICKMCGKDLNTGECDCDNFVPDPRMAGLKDIFSANKEV